MKLTSGSKSKCGYKGRSYQCRVCFKVDRKGRMMAHILKHHVPFDSVPYSCSLCNFRCQDKGTLVNHITHYRRHKEEVQKRGGRVDHSQVLRRSANPKFVSELDMVMLPREEPGRQINQTEDPLDENDGVFDDDEEDFDGLSLPDWAKDELVIPQAPYTAVPVSVSKTPTPKLPVFCLPGLPSPQSQVPSYPMSLVPRTTATTTISSTQSITSQMYHYPVHTSSQPVSTLSLQDLIAPSSSQQPIVSQHSLSQQMPANSGYQAPSNLGRFRPTNPPSSERETTPLLDEKDQAELDDILPGLLKAASESDPLLMEIQDELRSEKRSSEEDTTQTNASKKVKGESKANQKGDDHSCCTVKPDLTPLVDAIDRASRNIVDAIDRNSRATRCQGRTLDDVVSSLQRIEKLLEAQMEKRRSPSKETRQGNKENSRPILKSTISRVNSHKK